MSKGARGRIISAPFYFTNTSPIIIPSATLKAEAPPAAFLFPGTLLQAVTVSPPVLYPYCLRHVVCQCVTSPSLHPRPHRLSISHFPSPHSHHTSRHSIERSKTRYHRQHKSIQFPDLEHRRASPHCNNSFPNKAKIHPMYEGFSPRDAGMSHHHWPGDALAAS